MKIQAPPEWGIEPVPESHRILNFPDYFALWSSLGVGLLVLLAGTLLVPGLGLGQALLPFSSAALSAVCCWPSLAWSAATRPSPRW